MRRKVIVAVVVVVLAAIGYVGFLLSRDSRQYQLSKGSPAVIVLSDSDQMILENSSSEDFIPFTQERRPDQDRQRSRERPVRSDA
jgi:nitrogen fixation-related uncharacterized protein